MSTPKLTPTHVPPSQRANITTPELMQLMESHKAMYAALIIARRTLLDAGGDPMPTLDAIIAQAEGRQP